LLEIQKETHWLSTEVLRKVSKKLEVPMSKVLHTATFYKTFNLVPEANCKIQVCDGTSCHVRGSSYVRDTICEMIGIEPGELDSEFKFRLEIVTCRGNCSSGPVMITDKEHHRGMNPTRVKEVLQYYQ